MISRRLVLVASITLLQACTTLQTQNLQPDGLKAYRRAYVEAPLEDEFQVVPAMIAELSDMGFEIVARPFAEPTNSDLLVKVTPIGGWDMTRYLQSVTDSVYCGEVGPTRHLIILLLQGPLARGARRTA